MRVIKNGVTMQRDCPKCKSTLEITPRDIVDCLSHGIFVVCIVCNNKIPLTIAEMPLLFKQSVNWDE